MSPVPSSSDTGAVLAWEPPRWCRSVSALEARLSRGFLRSQPGRWFPGLAAHWLPLGHSLSSEIKVIEVRPSVDIPADMRSGFVCSIEDELFALYIDDISKSNLLEAVLPGGNQRARAVVLEYLARRMLTSLSLCWSGTENSAIRFEKDTALEQVKLQGTVRLSLSINGQRVMIAFGLGRMLTDRFDGLWRRQIRGASALGTATVLHPEITRLAVPPYSLSDYLKSGTMIDLELPLSSQVTLLSSGQPWIAAKLLDVAGQFAYETVSASIALPAMPEGMTSLSVHFPSFELEIQNQAEYQQAGAVVESPIPIGDGVHISIHGDKVCEARLCSYQGRFAVSIL